MLTGAEGANAILATTNNVEVVPATNNPPVQQILVANPEMSTGIPAPVNGSTIGNSEGLNPALILAACAGLAYLLFKKK